MVAVPGFSPGLMISEYIGFSSGQPFVSIHNWTREGFAILMGLRHWGLCQGCVNSIHSLRTSSKFPSRSRKLRTYIPNHKNEAERTNWKLFFFKVSEPTDAVTYFPQRSLQLTVPSTESQVSNTQHCERAFIVQTTLGNVFPFSSRELEILCCLQISL